MFHRSNTSDLSSANQMTKMYGVRIWTIGVILTCIAVGITSRPAHDRLLAVLRELPDEKLEILESLGRSWDDEEEMQGDQPISNDTTPRDRTISWDVLGGRDRELQIRTIKERVLKFAGRDESFNSSLPRPTIKQSQIIREVMDKSRYPWPIENGHHKKKRSFYPSCEIPRNTDEEAWTSSQTMNLYFDLTYPTPTQGLKLDIQSAKLWLFKNTLMNDGMYTTARTSLNQRIRVSAIYTSKAIKKAKDVTKGKIADSHMLTYSSNDWIELDVKSAVNTWRETGKNFGLVINVEDDESTMQSASRYFKPMNCSKEAVSTRPLPVSLIDLIQNKTIIAQAGIQFYPTIEIEISSSEYEPDVVGHHVLNYPITTEGRPHRIRHQPNRQSAAVNDSLEQIQWEDPTITSDR